MRILTWRTPNRVPKIGGSPTSRPPFSPISVSIPLVTCETSDYLCQVILSNPVKIGCRPASSTQSEMLFHRQFAQLAHFLPSLLDLFISRTPSEANLIKGTVRKVVEDREQHSLFAGVALAPARRTANMPSEAIDGVAEDGRQFTRSLLHLTPLKDGKVSKTRR